MFNNCKWTDLWNIDVIAIWIICQAGFQLIGESCEKGTLMTCENSTYWNQSAEHIGVALNFLDSLGYIRVEGWTRMSWNIQHWSMLHVLALFNIKVCYMYWPKTGQELLYFQYTYRCTMGVLIFFYSYLW